MPSDVLQLQCVEYSRTMDGGTRCTYPSRRPQPEGSSTGLGHMVNSDTGGPDSAMSCRANGDGDDDERRNLFN